MNMRRRPVRMIFIPVIVSMTIMLASAVVSGHESRNVGGVDLLVGWMTEPAYEGILNGVDFRVSRASESDHDSGNGHGHSGNAVEGLEDTVQVEITHDPSGTSRVFDLRAVWGSPGEYTADLLPTAPGGYEFRFFGTIEGMELDEVFGSASLGGGFNDVVSSVDMQFPEPRPEPREIESAVRGALGTAERAEQRAVESAERISGVNTLAIIALVIAIVSTVGTVLVGLKRR